MGPWLVLMFPSFKENVVATCKIVSFLSSLDNLLQKKVIVLFFRNQISKWRSFEKRAIFDPLFTFSSHQVIREKLQKILQHISHSHTYIHVFCSPYSAIDFFCLTNFEKIRIYQVQFLFGMSLVLILIRTILKQSINNKMVSKTYVGMSTTDMYLH